MILTAELHVNPGISNTGKWRLDWTRVFGIVLTIPLREKMSSATASSIEIVDNPKGKAVAWNYYGFVKSEGKVDKARFACKLCRIILKYSGNTSNLTDYIRRKKMMCLTLVIYVLLIMNICSGIVH